MANSPEMSRSPFDLIYEILVSNISPATGLIFLQNTFGSSTQELVDHVEGCMYATSDNPNRRPMYFKGEDIPVVLKKVSDISVAYFDGTIASHFQLDSGTSSYNFTHQEAYVGHSEDSVACDLLYPALASPYEDIPGHVGNLVNVTDTITRRCQWGKCDTVLALKGSKKEKEHICKEHINVHHFVDCQWRGCTCKKSVNKRCGKRPDGHAAHMVDITAHLIRHYELE